MVASCRQGPDFLSLWSIDGNTHGGALIVSADPAEDTPLRWGSIAWRTIAISLSTGAYGRTGRTSRQ